MREYIPTTELQLTIKSKFKQLNNKGVLTMIPPKSGTLLDFLGLYLDIVVKECPNGYIVCRLGMNGMLDQIALSSLDINKTLQTCKNRGQLMTYQDKISMNCDAMYFDFSIKGTYQIFS